MWETSKWMPVVVAVMQSFSRKNAKGVLVVNKELTPASAVKLCTAKLCLGKPKQNLSRSKLPKGFSTNKQTWVKLPVLSRSNHSRQQATLQHTLCFSRSGLSQRRSLGIQFKYCLKVTKTKEGFLSKLQTGFQSWRNSEKRSTEDQKLSFGSQTSARCWNISKLFK